MRTLSYCYEQIDDEDGGNNVNENIVIMFKTKQQCRYIHGR